MNDVEGMKTRVAAFDAQHGEPIRVDEELLFPDGARREVHPAGALHDPPTDEAKRLKAISIFWEERLNDARERFTKLKKHYVDHATFAVGEKLVPAPVAQPEVAKANLTALRDEVLHCQEKLKAVQDQINAAKPKTTGSIDRDREQRFARARRSNEELLQTCKSIRI